MKILVQVMQYNKVPLSHNRLPAHSGHFRRNYCWRHFRCDGELIVEAVEDLEAAEHPHELRPEGYEVVEEAGVFVEVLVELCLLEKVQHGDEIVVRRLHKISNLKADKIR